MKKKQPEMCEDFVSSQKKLLSLSSKSQQKIVENEDHFFPIKKPNIVTEELLDFFDTLQADSLLEK